MKELLDSLAVEEVKGPPSVCPTFHAERTVEMLGVLA